MKSIKYIGKEDVYNLEVEDHHNFSVNGGLIIHNCDSLRYGLMSRPVANVIKPEPPGKWYSQLELEDAGFKNNKIRRII